MDVRFDVTDLSEEERGALAGEVVVQAEASDYVGRDEHGWIGHRGVETPEVEWNEVEEILHLVPPPPKCDPEDPAFQELMEAEWWKLMQGELNLGDDPELRSILRSLRQYMDVQTWDAEGRLANDQLDGEGNEVEQLTEQEMARRFVRAIACVVYGGA